MLAEEMLAILFMYLKAFAVGGAICATAQIIINVTSLTSGKILVFFMLGGVVLTALGLYQPLVDMFGAGASVPISGFGCSLVNGAVEGAKADGLFGAIKGGLEATAPGIATAVIFGYINAVLFKPRTKKK